MLQLDIRTRERLPDRRAVQSMTQAGMHRAVKALQRHVQQNVGGGILRVRTGTLLSSLKARVYVKGAEVVGVVGTDVFYGRILNTGAKAHPIAASGTTFTRRGRRREGPGALHFFVGGREVFVRRLKRPHPGVRPTLWREQSALEAEPEIRAAFEQELARHLEAAGR